LGHDGRKAGLDAIDTARRLAREEASSPDSRRAPSCRQIRAWSTSARTSGPGTSGS